MLFSRLIEKIYRANMLVRRDPDGTIFYFSVDDFKNLKREPHTFKNPSGDTLQGYFYFYDNFAKDKILFFDHGMGVGHRAYLREIEMLARHGYKVFSYDHAGCSESEGETIRGFSGSIYDLDAAISYVKSLGVYSGCDIYVMGHSWGGFSTMNAPALHPDIKKIVALSGFESVSAVQNQFIKGILSIYRKELYELERQTNGKYAELSAIETLSNMSGEGLIIHSSDDKTVSAALHFERMRDALYEKENLTFVLVDGKDHNPNYTKDAIKYKDEFFAKRNRLMKKGKLKTEEEKSAFVKSFDWYKMTEQDETVWKMIFDFLDN